jgi:hypothetical protein
MGQGTGRGTGPGMGPGKGWGRARKSKILGMVWEGMLAVMGQSNGSMGVGMGSQHMWVVMG